MWYNLRSLLTIDYFCYKSNRFFYYRKDDVKKLKKSNSLTRFLEKKGSNIETSNLLCSNRGRKANLNWLWVESIRYHCDTSRKCYFEDFR